MEQEEEEEEEYGLEIDMVGEISYNTQQQPTLTLAQLARENKSKHTMCSLTQYVHVPQKYYNRVLFQD